MGNVKEESKCQLSFITAGETPITAVALGSGGGTSGLVESASWQGTPLSWGKNGGLALQYPKVRMHDRIGGQQLKALHDTWHSIYFNQTKHCICECLLSRSSGRVKVGN